MRRRRRLHVLELLRDSRHLGLERLLPLPRLLELLSACVTRRLQLREDGLVRGRLLLQHSLRSLLLG